MPGSAGCRRARALFHALWIRRLRREADSDTLFSPAGAPVGSVFSHSAADCAANGSALLGFGPLGRMVCLCEFARRFANPERE